MQPQTKSIDYILKVKDLFFTISAIVVVLLNLWLTSQLTPVFQDINDNSIRISASEESLRDFEESFEDLRENTSGIREDVAFIRGKLEN